MTEKIKVTKKNYFAALRTMVEGVDTVGDIPADDVLAFIDKEVAALEKKAASAKAKAAERKAEGDELRAAVKAVLTKDFQTADAITEQVDFDEVTKSKVVARLTQLVNAGEAVKEKNKELKVMTYKLTAVDSIEDAEDAE